MSEFVPSFEDREPAEVDALQSLVGDLEEIACRYDESYADGISGLFELSKKSGDRDGSVTHRVTVKAERIYSGAQCYLTNYEVSISTKYYGLSMHSFPEDLWQVISNDVMMDVSEVDDDEPHYMPDEDWLNELGDEETEFAVEFLYSHIVTDDNAIFTGHEMRAYVDERAVPLPDSRLIDVSISPDSQSTGENLEGLEEFMGLFDRSERDEFQILGKTAIHDFQLTDRVLELYSEMETAQSMDIIARVDRMRELAGLIFPELLKEDI